MKRIRNFIAIAFLFPQFLVGCGDAGNVNSNESKSNEPVESSPTSYISNCRYDSAVDSMIEDLRSKGGILTIEYAKQLYLDIKYEPDCSPQIQRLGSVLRPVWQSYVNKNAHVLYIGCLSNCSLASLTQDNPDCSPNCDIERTRDIDTNSQSISDFFQ